MLIKHCYLIYSTTSLSPSFHHPHLGFKGERKGDGDGKGKAKEKPFVLGMKEKFYSFL